LSFFRLHFYKIKQGSLSFRIYQHQQVLGKEWATHQRKITKDPNTLMNLVLEKTLKQLSVLVLHLPSVFLFYPFLHRQHHLADLTCL